MPSCRSAAAVAVAFLIALCATACGGGGESAPPPVVVTPPPPPPPPPPAGTLIGSAGGTVTGPNGASVVIPAGALSAEIRILIEQTSAGAPALPGGFTVAGVTYSFTPHGTTFAVPVTLTLPFDPALVPAGATPLLFKTINAQTQWQEISAVTLSGSTLSAAVTSFSFAQVLSTPAAVGRQVEREWSFTQYRGDSLTPELVDNAVSSGGVLSEVHDYGATAFDSALTLIDGSTRGEDGIANGAVGSSEDGERFYVAAEAPAANANLPDNPVGSSTKLYQVQSFVKRASDATLRVTIPRVYLDVHDRNAALGRTCPAHHGDGLRCSLILARLGFTFMVFDTSFPDIQLVASLSGTAQVDGYAENWHSFAVTDAPSDVPFWSVEDFNFDITSEVLNGATESHVVMTLANTHTFPIDLSKIEVGKTFHVTIDAVAFAYNLIAGPPSEYATSSGAYFMEAPGAGGPTLTSTGLDPVSTPSGLELPDSAPVVVRACEPGPGPNANAGTIQFALADYSIAESTATRVVEVTRTGGTAGAVSATFRTSDGTAVAGTDYSPVETSVVFADGDDEPRFVEVRPIEDDVGGEPSKTVNLALSQPGGCAALGARTTAVLTIRDDDRPPPPPSGLDATFGVAGEASSPAFGGDRSGMALQADGKIVMVGGTFTDFVMARFNANGTLDAGFGTAGNGKVTTNIVNNEQEEALAVAVQPDGKIVVAGYTGQAVGPSVFAVARFDANGVLDPSFGTAGIATGSVTGHAYAVALQNVGAEVKILVGGDTSDEDFALLRLNANGTLDGSFGTAGIALVNVAGAGDRIENIAVQPDGAILVSGGSSVGANSTGLARFTANGTLDSTFGDLGRLLLAGRKVGDGLAVQSDGGIILAGQRETATAPATQTVFEIMRLTPAGVPDPTFGTQGIVDTAVSTRGDRAMAVTVQPDGKIVAAGVSSAQTNSNFAVVRYTPQGVPDPAFGNGTGMLTVDFFGFTDVAENVSIQADGKIVVGGLARDNVDGYGVTRINP